MKMLTFLLLLFHLTKSDQECIMSLDDVLSWKTDCSNYQSVAEGSWESCRDACLANPDCIGVQTDTPWDHCESIMNANVEECDEGDFTFYPKNCAAETAITETAVAPCETFDNDICVFPFIYNGVQYESCTTADHDVHWCATSINSDYTYHTWGNCNMYTSNCDTDVLTGEQACENHGYSKWECNTIGCCQWDDFGYGECHSAVGDTLCYNHVDYSSLQSIGIIITIVAVVMVFFISCVCFCCKCCCFKKKKDVIQPQSPQKVVVSETDMSPEAVKRRKMIAKAKQAQKGLKFVNKILGFFGIQIPYIDALPVENIVDIASNVVEKLNVSDNVLIQVAQSAETLAISCGEEPEEVIDEPPAYNA